MAGANHPYNFTRIVHRQIEGAVGGLYNIAYPAILLEDELLLVIFPSLSSSRSIFCWPRDETKRLPRHAGNAAP
jgi:hypothetical protein